MAHGIPHNAGNACASRVCDPGGPEAPMTGSLYEVLGRIGTYRRAFTPTVLTSDPSWKRDSTMTALLEGIEGEEERAAAAVDWVRRAIAALPDRAQVRIAQAALATEPEFIGRTVDERIRALEIDGISLDTYRRTRPKVLGMVVAWLEQHANPPDTTEPLSDDAIRAVAGLADSAVDLRHYVNVVRYYRAADRYLRDKNAPITDAMYAKDVRGEAFEEVVLPALQAFSAFASHGLWLQRNQTALPAHVRRDILKAIEAVLRQTPASVPVLLSFTRWAYASSGGELAGLVTTLLGSKEGRMVGASWMKEAMEGGAERDESWDGVFAALDALIPVLLALAPPTSPHRLTADETWQTAYDVYASVCRKAYHDYYMESPENWLRMWAAVCSQTGMRVTNNMLIMSLEVQEEALLTQLRRDGGEMRS
jgi:hypothetical protein